jgi:hypothetical protein
LDKDSSHKYPFMAAHKKRNYELSYIFIFSNVPDCMAE